MNRDKESRRSPDLSSPGLRSKPPGEPTIDRPSQSRLGDHLRAMYDDLMQQPVPDRFVDLINQLNRGRDGEGPR